MRKIILSLLTFCLISSFLAAAEPCSIVYAGLSDEGNWDLWLVNEDGTTEKRLTETPWDERHPAFSKDGKRIAYSVSDGSIRVHDIAKDTHEKLELPEGMYDHPRFSPDGRQLYFTAYFINEDTGLDDSHIARYNLVSEKFELIIEQEKLQDFVDVSPGGKDLVYATGWREEENNEVVEELWKHNLPIGDSRQLTALAANSIYPRFSPGGSEVLFLANVDNGYGLYRLSLKDRAKPIALKHLSSAARPAWGKGETIFLLDPQEKIRKLSPGKEATQTLEIQRKIMSFDVWCDYAP